MESGISSDLPSSDCTSQVASDYQKSVQLVVASIRRSSLQENVIWHDKGRVLGVQNTVWVAAITNMMYIAYAVRSQLLCGNMYLHRPTYLAYRRVISFGTDEFVSRRDLGLSTTNSCADAYFARYFARPFPISIKSVARYEKHIPSHISVEIDQRRATSRAQSSHDMCLLSG